jgi:hypothetical protein
MTEAARWLTICLDRLGDHSIAVVTDQWCRRILSDAAVSVGPCGADGTVWRFADRSLLIANSDTARVR